MTALKPVSNLAVLAVNSYESSWYTGNIVSVGICHYSNRLFSYSIISNLSSNVLTRCKLDRPGLHALVDAYQGCFKNNVTHSSERRYFAGIIYLLFPFCYVVFIVTPFTAYTPFIIFKTCLLIMILSMIALFRPYKRAVHNFTSFMSLVVVAVYTLFGTFLTMIGILPIIIILYIPFLVLCSYLTYRLFKPYCLRLSIICKIKTARNPTNDEPPPPEDQVLPVDVSVTTVALDDFVADDL